MSAALKQLEREIFHLAEKVRRIDGLELMTVSSASRLLKTSSKWVRENIPVIVHGAKGRRVRVADIEAFQSRHTLLPKNGSSFAKATEDGVAKDEKWEAPRYDKEEA